MKKVLFPVIIVIITALIFMRGNVTKKLTSNGISSQEKWEPKNKVHAFWREKAEARPPSVVSTEEPQSQMVEKIKFCYGNKPCPWVGIPPLTGDERARFDKKATKAARYFMLWGKFSSDEQRDEFIATVVQLGERGLAEYARELDALGDSKTHITDAESKVAIMKLDLLQTLANRKHPTAMSMVEALATRTIPLDNEGHVQKTSESRNSYVTWENFEIYSLSTPEKAIAFVNAIPKKEHRYPYAYHYFVGQKLAGLTQIEAKANAERAFGKDVIMGLGLPD